MSNIRLVLDSTSNVDDTSQEDVFIGHFTASVADTTDGVAWNGEVVMELNEEGNWITAETFDAAGVFPGFNGIGGTYRLRLKTKQTAGTALVVVNGFDKPTNIPY